MSLDRRTIFENAKALPAADQAALVEQLGEQSPEVRTALCRLAGRWSADEVKLDYVSLYPSKETGKWLLAYRVPGFKRRVDRLGRDHDKAKKWARTVSETLDAVKSKEITAQEAYRRLYVDRQPIEQHVKEFRSSLVARKVVPDYLANTMYRLEQCIKLGTITRVDQITPGTWETILKKLSEHVDEQDKKLTPQTINYYLRVLKQFTRWLRKGNKITVNPLEFIEGLREGGHEDRRREVQFEELRLICVAAQASKSSHHLVMPGKDRAMLYAFAFCTGLRRNELRAAEVSWLRVDVDEPHLLLPAKFAKARKRAELPLPGWMVTAIKAWLGNRSKGQLFKTMPQEPAKAFERDRFTARTGWTEEKGIEDKERKRRRDSDFLKRSTADGKMVFHSLRHGFGSALLESGADMKMVQTLMRHGTIALTMNRYGHTARSRLAGAVEGAIGNLIPEKSKAPEEAKRKA